MCFSATASFAAFGLLSLTGATVLRRAVRRKLGPGMLLLSSFPLVFGVQQGFEGLVWLGIHGALPAPLMGVATYGFLVFALLFWPIAGPVAGYLIETKRVRRLFFIPLIVAGAAIGLYLMIEAVRHPVPPLAVPEWGGHIVYMLNVEVLKNIEYFYFFTASTALLASSDSVAFRFGLALTVSFVATLIGYEMEVLPSVWCLFAALCSLIIVHGVWRRDAHAERQITQGQA